MCMLDKGELAKQIFPHETWKEISQNLFTTTSRIPKNEKEKERLEKEIRQAQILTENNYTVYLVPEPSDGGKKFDAFVDNRKTELKRVTGNIKAVGKNFRNALHQGDDIFLSIKDASLHGVYKKIVSETKDVITKAKNKNLSIDFSDRQVFISIDNDRKLHIWQLKNIEETARKLADKKQPRKNAGP